MKLLQKIASGFTLSALVLTMFAPANIPTALAVTANITQIAFTASPSSSVEMSVPGKFIFQTQNISGVEEKVEVNSESFSLSSSSATGTFYSASLGGACTGILASSQVTLLDNQANKAFCYSDTTPGNHAITVTLNSNTSVTGTSSIVVNSAPVAATAVTRTSDGETFNSLQEALDDAGTNDGDTLRLDEDLTITEQITIDRPIVIDGNDKTIAANFSKTSNSNNAAIGVIGTNNVTIQDLVIEGSSGVNLHGVNLYESSAINLNSLTINNNDNSAVVVNRSVVSINSITTNGNGASNLFSVIDVSANGQSAQATITGSSTHGEPEPKAHVLSIQGTDAVFIDSNDQYINTPFTFEGITYNVYRLGQDTEPEETSAMIVATKIICEDESDLPNWGNNGPDITASTAADFLAEHESCRLASDWQFQWAPPTTSYTGGDVLGENSAPWVTFGPTGVNGQAQVVIPDADSYARFEAREVLKGGYLPFSDDLENNKSAEIYCHNDVYDYDNWEWINNPQAGQTYHCVAWNVADDRINQEVEVPEQCTFVETVTVDSSNPNGSNSVTSFTNGVDYFAKISGVFNFGASIDSEQNSTRPGANNDPNDNFSDAEYSSWNAFVNFFNPDGNTASDSPHDLYVDGQDVELGIFNHTHEYSYEFVGAGTIKNFKIYEAVSPDWYNDNSGNLKVDIYRCDEPIDPEPGQCKVEIVSDLSVFVEERERLAVATYEHPNWTAEIEGASWIWAHPTVIDPVAGETYTFTKYFDLELNQLNNLMLEVAADNSYQVFLNDVLVGGDTSHNNFQLLTQDTYGQSVLSPVAVIGENILKIVVTNLPLNNGTPQSNPAGLMFKLTAQSSECDLDDDDEDDEDDEDNDNDSPSASITNPSAGQVVSGAIVLGATYNDGDGDNSDNTTSAQFAVRSGSSCTTNTVFGNVDGFTATYTFENGIFGSNFNSGLFPDGEYCFVFNPTENLGDSDVRLTRLFTIDNSSPITTSRGGGGGLASSSAGSGDEEGSVLGESTSNIDNDGDVLGEEALSCNFPLLNEYMNRSNNPSRNQVLRLQFFMRVLDNISVPFTGLFDLDTETGVKQYQTKYASEILTPWGLVTPTGYVYLTTRRHINERFCQNYNEEIGTLLPDINTFNTVKN